uniref:nuclear pore complex protein Nup153 isoform X7 n=1 Tax=Pristiophorus japonicus TaxID=55135 RepID=UPI00398F5AC1
MAAAHGGGGGGKIRSKRHHIISKPYAKNQGIIGRVTDTVKNIVPGWLQKYFGHASKSEPAEAKRSIDNHENDPVLINKTPPFDNGRHNPAPPASNAAVSTPSSKSVLNFSEMLLLRPALNRAHFNCATIDTPTHDCQPSTSSSFPIGSSGFSLVKEIKDSGSLHEDDNISTTSGFSSRASDKDVMTSRNASLPPLWSPEGDRFHSVPQQPATSLKRPSFNLSAFGSSPPSFISTSLLNSSQLGDSPFYPGKTTYGGAAAARASQMRGTPYQVPIRRQMKAKPASSPSYGVTSATARRILQSLEKMSSPLADAKRIPSTMTSSLSMPLERSTIDVTGWQSKVRKQETQSPPVQKLQAPMMVSGAANRSIFFKPSLTPGGQGNRHIDRTEIRNNIAREKLPIPEINLQTTKSDSSCSYPIIGSRATNGLTSGGAGGKMKREKGHYSSRGAQEVQAPALELPEVSLPIKTTALPTFNFGSPCTAVSPVTPTVTKSFSDKAVVSSPSSVAFTFSTPNIKATEANLQPASVSTGFTFSEPIDKSIPLVFVSARPSINAAKCISSPISTPTNKRKDECDGQLKTAKTLKQGSVLDILKGPGFTSPPSSTQCVIKSLASTPATVKPLPSTTEENSSSIESSSTFGFGDKFKPAEGSWQCGSCFLQNKSTDSKCVACQTAKSAPPLQTNNESASKGMATSKETPLNFGDKFKPAVGIWGCDTCLVQNKLEAVKCVACEKPKLGTGVKPAMTLPVVTESTSNRELNMSNNTSVCFGLADQFKKPEGVWDCSVCLVQNKAEDSKCVACQSAKPGILSVASNIPSSTPTGGILGFGDKFKKPTGFWDCEVCLVQNSSNVTKCVACQSEKPGSKIEPKVKSAEKPEATEPVQQGFVFGTAINTSEQGVAKPAFSLFGNSSSASAATNAGVSTPSTIFGSSAPATNPSFLFGQASATVGSANPASSSESTVPANKPFLFGSQEVKSAASTSSTGTSAVPFPFGSAPSNNTATSSVFTFGASTTTSSSTGGSSNPMFGFGSSSTAAANPPAFGSSQTTVPVFGQSGSQPPAPFGSSGAPTFAFSTGCQQPAFGSQSTNSQPSLFGGQLPNQQPTFGSTSSTSSNSFQFGNSGSGFNFNATNSSNEVFKFGSASTGATQQPGPTGGFPFNPVPAFSVGVGNPNPFSATSGGRSNVTGRKIKTAVRRKK